MVRRVRHTCVLLWILGILGMWAARALLAHEAAEAPFRIAAALWVLGGIGFTWFAGLGCLEQARAVRPSAPARPPPQHS